MADLRLSRLCKTYEDENCVLRDIDLSIRDGEFMVFVGPSGCGKSTTLRMIAGLEEISSGELQIGGKTVNDVPAAKRGVAMVFQSYALYPHMTVRENMGFSLKLARHPQTEIDRAVGTAAETLQITHLLDRKPKALSGGQRQRVAIGRAIVRKPDVFLFDEPLSNLDASLRVQMRIELAKLHEKLATTMIYVTHDQVEAMTLGDRIAVFNGGRIEQVGTPLELYENPVNQFVAGFLGSPKMNFLPAKLADHGVLGSEIVVPGNARLTVPIACALPAGSALTLGLRPEHIQWSATATVDAIPASVDLIEHLGDEQIGWATAEGGAAQLAFTLPGRQKAPGRGERIWLQPQLDSCHLFSSTGQSIARQGAPH